MDTIDLTQKYWNTVADLTQEITKTVTATDADPNAVVHVLSYLLFWHLRRMPAHEADTAMRLHHGLFSYMMVPEPDLMPSIEEGDERRNDTFAARGRRQQNR